MSELADFAKHVDDVLSDSSRIGHWTVEQSKQYMADYALHRDRFEQLAMQLMQAIVAPRVATVIDRFSNAQIAVDQLPHRITCWFDACDRFPALARIEFSIEHDVRFEKLTVHTQSWIRPAFVRYREQDNLTQSLNAVRKGEVADWVEERLLEFIDTYMRIDAGEEDPAAALATDPVCGMKIDRSKAATTDSYYGHSYYFCSNACHAAFQEHPEAYVQIKTL